MNALDLLESHRADIEQLCHAYKVIRLRVFGSAVTQNWNPNLSDIDFLVEYGPGHEQLQPLDALVGFKLALEDLLGRSVDVVDWSGVHNPYFRKYASLSAQEFYAT